MSSSCLDRQRRHAAALVRNGVVGGLLALGLIQFAAAAAAADELRICADPNNLPFSNNRLEGFENKIAQLVADDLKLPISYTWHPQRRGFIRQTLKAGLCDVVVGVPVGWDPVLSTNAYYASSYVFVYQRQKQVDLRTFDDPALRQLRIGLQAFGDDGANSPAAHALARRGIVGNVVGYSLLNTAESPPGRLIDAVAAGEIDVAIAWGPFAGPYAQRQATALAVVPVVETEGRSAQPFVYAMAMGVRRGDTALKARLDEVLTRRHDDIVKVLQSYGVPLVSDVPVALAP